MKASTWFGVAGWACFAIAGVLVAVGMIWFTGPAAPTYGHDHALIAQVVKANDAMQAHCKGGWAGLELKADGTSEVVGHCPPVRP